MSEVPIANPEDERLIQDLADEADSLLSQPARSSNKSLESSEGVIIENLDGTIQHGCLIGVQPRPKPELTGRERFPNYPANRVIFIIDDDEIAVYSSFFEMPSTIDNFLKLLENHSRNFIILLFLITALSLFLCERAYDTINFQLDKLTEKHPNTSREAFEKILYASIITELALTAGLLIVGSWAAIKRSVNGIKTFNTIFLMGIIIELLLSIIDRFEISIFMARYFAFLYARFLDQLITSLLLLPR